MKQMISSFRDSVRRWGWRVSVSLAWPYLAELHSIRKSLPLFAKYTSDASFLALEKREAFDKTYDTETTQIVEKDQLGGASHSRVEAAPYRATPAGVVRQALLLVDGDYGNYVYVDAGCGKGRTVLIASQLPFSRCIGVDFSPDLIKVANNNLVAFGQSNAAKNRAPVDFFCSDINEFQLPEQDIVFFMYEPFGLNVLHTLMNRIKLHIEKDRKVILLWCGHSRPVQLSAYRAWLKPLVTIEPFPRWFVFAFSSYGRTSPAQSGVRA